mmetsp:Transcript_3649/g.7836  ORF Transcript_3649/g.7836 Transcript_3649/m.7836 type:complete len:507 (-) Transcript_3649:30-1550(-)
MESVQDWAVKHLSEIMREFQDPYMVKEVVSYLFTLGSPSELRTELSSILGIDPTVPSITGAHKANFIDEIIERRFPTEGPKKKKKGKQIVVNFNPESIKNLSKELSGPALNSRRLCYCMATEHDLIGNCLACGKIVCAIEGRGHCMFCGHLVLPKGEFPNSIPDEASFVAAFRHKDRLLGYERDNDKNKIYDDQTDWFELADNVWLTEEDRAEARALAQDHVKLLQAEQLNYRVDFDIESGQTTHSDAAAYIESTSKEERKEASTKFLSGAASRTLKPSESLADYALHVYTQVMGQIKSSLSEERKVPKEERFSKLQHDDPYAEVQLTHKKPQIAHEDFIYSESEDKRYTLSMHQPWASLVIEGFKRVEGRSWPSDFKGPLWIHAAAKKPTEEEIKTVEEQYNQLYRDVENRPPFPSRYPTGVLLGRIELKEVVPRAQYVRATEGMHCESSDCNYLFIVKNPQKLLVPIKMLGGKKIYMLDDSVWKGAKQGLRRVYTGWWKPRKFT